MFGRKKHPEQLSFDRSRKYPAIKCSICNGEQVGGLKDRTTGEFEEIMLIRGPEDLARFKDLVQETNIEKFY